METFWTLVIFSGHITFMTRKFETDYLLASLYIAWTNQGNHCLSQRRSTERSNWGNSKRSKEKWRILVHEDCLEISSFNMSFNESREILKVFVLLSEVSKTPTHYLSILGQGHIVVIAWGDLFEFRQLFHQNISRIRKYLLKRVGSNLHSLSPRPSCPLILNPKE